MKKFELPRTPAQWLEAVMNAIFFLCGILAVGCVAVITIYMFLSGLPAIGKIGPLNFLFGTEWASTASEPKYGILPFLLSSIYGTLGASLIGVPVGLLTAVFLSKAAAPGVRNVVVTAVELLSDKAMLAAVETGARTVALAGGVASNSGLRNTMNDKCQKAGLRLVMPPPILCTDNAAMIGSAAFYRLMRGEIAGLDLNACPSLRLVYPVQ